MRYGKSDLLHLAGRIRQNSYEKSGERVHTVDLIAERVRVIPAHDWPKGHEDQDDDRPED
ncbi:MULTISPECIES: hypothetical protein [Sphingomonas]|uniref:Uncharacterized protein n=1 Tax=Sphingomonas kyungheensis TaxID=1069987 RepID=A0ABU8H6K7_9SPHN|nr:hypothetical protein [Sphingomonas sp. CV7422]